MNSAPVEHASLPVGGRDVAALQVVQPGEGGAGLVLVHDIIGMTEVTRGHVERLGSLGYSVVAPDLFDRDRGRVACVVKTMGEFRARTGHAWEILDAARGRLVDTGTDPGRVGAIGFCMGGGFALAYAARADLRVAAPFYGEVPSEVLDSPRGCAVVGGWGARDRVFVAQGRRLLAHLEDTDTPHDVVIYPEAGHSYMDDHRGRFARLGRYSPMRAEYDPAAAEDSWRRLESFLAAQL